jgi:lipoprotein signal peptidase
VADASICAGALLLAADLFFFEGRRRKENTGDRRQNTEHRIQEIE